MCAKVILFIGNLSLFLFFFYLYRDLSTSAGGLEQKGLFFLHNLLQQIRA